MRTGSASNAKTHARRTERQNSMEKLVSVVN
jgi:hypothetical protein